MTTSITVNHSFETGHRLPHLEGKCESLHGHSWKVEVTISAPQTSAAGTLAMFGDLKRDLRTFVDRSLDHGLMLGGADPLVAILVPHGKVFVFDDDSAPTFSTNDLIKGLYWPTVENVAHLLARYSRLILEGIDHVDGAYVSGVTVSETSTNSATWTAKHA